VTTDIAGKEHAHALRLDAEAPAEVKKSRLHRKVATTILFESNGGQQRGEATLPEVRLAVAEPALDIGNVEQCLEALTDASYFLAAEKNRYRFSFQPNLNKLLATGARASARRRWASWSARRSRKVFGAGSGLERLYSPRRATRSPIARCSRWCGRSGDGGDRRGDEEPAHTDDGRERLVVADVQERAALAVAEDETTLLEEARKLLAWKDIDADADELKLDETQQRQLAENKGRAERDLREAVWRAYKNVFLLADGSSLRKNRLGLVHSSAAGTLVELILSRLRQEDIVAEGVSPNLLRRYWPPACRSGAPSRCATPSTPRPSSRGCSNRGGEGHHLPRARAGTIAYVGKAAGGGYEPFVYKRSLGVDDIEISEDVYLITKEKAEEYLAKKATPRLPRVRHQSASGGEATPGRCGRVRHRGP
jgi:hypothetical protein